MFDNETKKIVFFDGWADLFFFCATAKKIKFVFIFADVIGNDGGDTRFKKCVFGFINNGIIRWRIGFFVFGVEIFVFCRPFRFR